MEHIYASKAKNRYRKLLFLSASVSSLRDILVETQYSAANVMSTFRMFLRISQIFDFSIYSIYL
jgi:hypothetical protein